jgi:4-amino-4-deoxy-L-arabinose transferase-like glycosyltransferase
LAVIVLSACLLSSIWVFRVPLLQNPDETSHIDYAFSIYSAGRLLNVRTPPSEWNVHAQHEGRKDRQGFESFSFEMMSHQYTLYLIGATDFQRIRFHPEQKVAADYGTRAYYERLNANAPQTPARLAGLQPQDNPWLITAYPFLYYALVAIVQKVISFGGSGPVWLFFAARLLSVLLLAGSLVLTYAVLRELRVAKTHALMLTAVVGFFPQTIFVAASVQPDNLTLFLVLLCTYYALLLKRQDSNRWRQLVLGLALGALLVTKYHFFLFIAFAVAATVISEHIYRRHSFNKLLRQLPLLVLPSIVFFAVQLWIGWGGKVTGWILQSAKTSLPSGLRNAFWDYYRGGAAFISWWGMFGWGDCYLFIWSPQFQVRVWQILTILTLIMIVLVAARVVDVMKTLITLVRRGRWRMSLRLLFSNPLLTSHFPFLAFMILLYALTDNSFFAQGRHWFPFTLSSFFMTLQFAPRIFASKKRRILANVLMVGMLIYCGVAGYFALKSITDRYYPRITSNESQ